MMHFGAVPTEAGVAFTVWSGTAERVWVCLFDERDRETDRIEMTRGEDGLWSAFVSGLTSGARYGLRTDGPYEPANGQWFDPAKLLVDPHALELDRAYRYDAKLGAPRETGIDTASLMPKALVTNLPAVPLATPNFAPGGLIYELSVRGFTMRHPDVPEAQRGTIAALGHPAVIDHLKKLKVSAVELMPIVAWMDERHLPPLGLANAWGYNPVTFAALDPRLAPGGWRELRETVAALHAAGIGVILDLVFNHTAESDAFGTTLSLRGLDNRAYFRHVAEEPHALVNDTGTGNTVACDREQAQRLVLDALHAFVRYAGVDGFRFDLATVLGRMEQGFDRDAELLRAIAADPEIGSRVLIAEPWDIGPGGYQLGNFPPPFLEWNDRFRDDVRRFWRGDTGIGELATRLSGSSDIFDWNGESRTRSVNFLAAHDGMVLADLVAYRGKHNLANGEDNRDGHDDDISWNHGVEGPSDDENVISARRADLEAMLATLFVSRGTIMLTAGDEFGRTQHGNNNAYAQDNETTWLDWQGRDRDLEAFTAELAGLRERFGALSAIDFLNGSVGGDGVPDVAWLGEDGAELSVEEWEDPNQRVLVMMLRSGAGRIAVVFNAGDKPVEPGLPGRESFEWRLALSSAETGSSGKMPGRSVSIYLEESAA